MPVTIDQLQIELQSSGKGASDGINELSNSLSRLKRAVNSTSTDRLAKGFEGLQRAIGQVSAGSGAALQSLSAGLKSLADVPKQKISASTASQISAIGEAVRSLTGADASQLSLLAVGLESLAQVGKSSLTATTANQIRAIGEAIRTLDGTNYDSVRALAVALVPLETIGKSNLGGILGQLKQIPEVINALDDEKLTAFASKIQQVVVAVRPLAAEMEKVSAGFSRLPANIQKAINANAKLTVSNKGAAKSYGFLGTGISAVTVKFSMIYLAVRRIGSVIGGWIKESNDYVENLNLFTVSMGKYAGEAQKYAEYVSEVMGIDPSDWMRNQGIFMTLATGFGVASEKAALMSKNMTQLGYDLSSFFNITVEDAMQKLQSGLSGELEPLRRLGYDLSQAKLQAIALSLGIDKSVSSMTQAEKSQLRYYAIMTQVTTAQGDMARTLEAPANQLRILQAQATQAARALGNIFIPALNKVLPYAIAFLKVIRWVAGEIASLFGFSLPEMDYSGLGNITSAGEDASEALGGAADSAKELKNAVMGFDELNVLSPQTSSGAGGGAGGVGSGGDLGIDLPDYSDSFLAGLTESRAAGIFESWKKNIEPTVAWLKENFETVKTLAITIGTVILGWKLATGFANAITQLSNLSKTGTITLGLTMLAGGIGLDIDNIKSILSGEYKAGSAESGIKSAISAALKAGGLGLLLKPAVGAGAAFAISVPVAITLTALAVSLSTEAGQSAIQNGVAALQALIKGETFSPKFSKEMETGWFDILLGIFSPGSAVQSLSFRFFGSENGREFVEGLRKAFSAEGVAYAIKGIIAAFILTKEKVLEGWETVKGWFKKDVTEPVEKDFEGTNKNITRGFGVSWTDIKSAWSPAAEWLKSKFTKPTSKNFDDSSQESQSSFSNLKDAIYKKWEPVSGWFKKNVSDPLTKNFDGVNADGSSAFSNLKKNVTTAWEKISGWFKDNVTDPITEKFSDVKEDVSSYFSAAWGNIKGVWGKASGWFGENVTVPVTEKFSDIKENVTGFFNDTWEDIKGVWKDVSGWFEENVTKPIKEIFEGLDLKFKLPHFTWTSTPATGWMKTVLDTLGIPASLPKLSVSWYASGGFPDMGELFIAREAGPEMVGTIGNRTAVANNSQIVESVSQGVADAQQEQNALLRRQNALLEAILAKSGDVRLDGRKVASTLERIQREKGVVIAGGAY